MIEGCNLPITQTAFDMLVRRASPWRTRHIWIDAICINQDDINDKNQQVRMMRDIYGRASRTLIWLGDAPNALLCWAFFEQLDEQRKKHVDDAEFSTALMRMKRIRDGNPKSTAFARMLENQYW